MAWVRIDDSAPEHRKFLALAALSKRGTVGAAAAWLWTCGLAYCNRQPQRDGYIPFEAVPRLYPVVGAMSLATRLVEVGLWESVIDGFHVHDYHEYQPNAARIVDHQERGRRGGLKSGAARSQRATSGAPATDQRATSERPATHQRQTSDEYPSLWNHSEQAKQTGEPPSRPVPIPARSDPPIPPAGDLPLFAGQPIEAGASLPADAFDVFAKLYPAHRRNQGKSRARKRFAAEITTPALLVQLRAALRAYLAQLERDGTDPKYVQHFGTFMGCWRDYLDVAGTETMDTRGPMERAMDDYHSARERVRGGRALDGDVELVTRWEQEHPRN